MPVGACPLLSGPPIWFSIDNIQSVETQLRHHYQYISTFKKKVFRVILYTCHLHYPEFHWERGRV